MKDLYSFKHISYFLWNILFATATISCSGQHSHTSDSDTSKESYFINSKGDTIRILVQSEAQWRKQLSPQEFDVLRKKGTERAFTGSLLDIKENGQYVCKACRYPLFSSEHKYDSGSGWPSFYDALDKNAILEETDYHLGYARTEVMCKRCRGHLGHVFPDGPAPTGLRYCVNSVSIDFQKAEK